MENIKLGTGDSLKVSSADSGEVSFSIDRANRGPSWKEIPDFSVTEGEEEFLFSPEEYAQDPEGDPLTFTSSSELVSILKTEEGDTVAVYNSLGAPATYEVSILASDGEFTAYQTFKLLVAEKIVVPPPEPPDGITNAHTDEELAAMVRRGEHAANLWTPGNENSDYIFTKSVSKPPKPSERLIANGLSTPPGWYDSVESIPADLEGEIWKCGSYKATPNSPWLKFENVDKYNKGINTNLGKGDIGTIMPNHLYKAWPQYPAHNFSGKVTEIENVMLEKQFGGTSGIIEFPDGVPGVYRLMDNVIMANPFDFYQRPERVEFDDSLPQDMYYDHVTGCIFKDWGFHNRPGASGEKTDYTYNVKFWYGTKFLQKTITIRVFGPKLTFGVGGDFGDPTGPQENAMRLYCEAVNVRNMQTPVFILPGEYEANLWGKSQFMGNTAGDRFYVGYDHEDNRRRPVVKEFDDRGMTYAALPCNSKALAGRINFFSNLTFGGTGHSGEAWRSQVLVNCEVSNLRPSADLMQTGGKNENSPGKHRNQGPSSYIRWRSDLHHSGRGNTEHLDYGRGKGALTAIYVDNVYRCSYQSINMKCHADKAVIIGNKFIGSETTDTYEEYMANARSGALLNIHSGCNALIADNDFYWTYVKVANSTKHAGQSAFLQFDTRRPKANGTRPVFGGSEWTKEHFVEAAERGINNFENPHLYVHVLWKNRYHNDPVKDIPMGYQEVKGAPYNDISKGVKFVNTYPRMVEKMFGHASVFGDPGGKNPVEAGIAADWEDTKDGVDRLNEEGIDRSECWWFDKAVYWCGEEEFNDLGMIEEDVDDPNLDQRDPSLRKYTIISEDLKPGEAKISKYSDPGVWYRMPRPRIRKMTQEDFDKFTSRGW